jgi:dTDP-glucose 4,6-dehydratase
VIASTTVRGGVAAGAATIDDQDLAPADLDYVLERAGQDLSRWRGARLLLTGATGFVGSWLLDSILHANRHMGLDARVVVLVRDVNRLPRRAASSEHVVPVVGDIRTFHVPGMLDGVMHCAASSRAPFGVGDGAPRTMAHTIVGGTTRVLDLAAASGNIPFLQVSSGAVYGPAQAVRKPLREELTSGPDITNPRSAYAEAKRMAETLCSIAASGGGPAATIARCFAFAGPRVPLDAHFAAGNFVADVLEGRPVRVQGDGRAKRSYLHPADLTVWLWAVLSRGQAGRAYNVGSERPVSILELAQATAAAGGPGHGVVVEGGSPDAGAGDFFVPSTSRIRSELGVEEGISLEDGLRRTLDWYRGASE